MTLTRIPASSTPSRPALAALALAALFLCPAFPAPAQPPAQAQPAPEGSERLLSVEGAAFGLEPVLLQSAWFRPHNRSEDIDRLYLVGAGTHPGAGVPAVLCSAKILDEIVPAPATVRAR